MWVYVWSVAMEIYMKGNYMKGKELKGISTYTYTQHIFSGTIAHMQCTHGNDS